MVEAITQEGLEVLATGGVGWCDIDAHAVRLVELKGELFLRLHLKGLLYEDDEYLPYNVALSNDRIRVASRVADHDNVQLLRKGMRVCGLAKMPDCCGWHDAIIKDLHTIEAGEWLVEVAWNLAKDCTEDPVNNVISVSRGEVCIISLGSPSLHPDLIHWRKMIRTVLAARPDFANSKFKKFKHGSIDPITSEPYKLDLWFVDDAVSGEVDKSKDACLHKDEADKIELEKQLERWSQRIALDGSSSKNEGSTDSAEACRDQGGNTDTINLCSFGSKISIEDSIELDEKVKDSIDSNLTSRRCPVLDPSCLEGVRCVADLEFLFHENGKIDVYLP